MLSLQTSTECTRYVRRFASHELQLAGPMELWIQDGNDVRLALSHDVDAGTLKKVVLSDGAVVTVNSSIFGNT
uniref:Uncharacterized protein n=1 Tax=Setaria viridis TaxID=4556 RepID=A0A4U6VVX3_SETVI|nr:hypothetical protein SEVIR_2G283500v2 [Setaria viridis]